MTVFSEAPLQSVRDLVDEARQRLDRLSPQEAYDELRDGALLVDIRQESFRREGEQIAGSIVLERNVLEWRLDPASEFRIPEATTHDRRIILICPHGDASTLAAIALHSVGLHRATDVIGGFEGWKAARLPMTSGFTETGSYVLDGNAVLTIDLAAQTVQVFGRTLALSRMELIVLSELLRASGRVVTRDELNRAIGHWDGNNSRAVDLTVHRLRRRLGLRVAGCIETVRGVGFRLHTSASGCS